MSVLANYGWREVSVRFWLFILFLLLILFTGGSSRADAQSLAILRPIALIVCGFAAFTINRDQLRQYQTPILLMCFVVAIPMVQLLPFYSFVPARAPSGQIVSAIDFELGLPGSSRALAMAPYSTMNAFFSLGVPLAVFLLGCQLTKKERALLLPVTLIIGLLSGLWGLLQVTGGGQSSLYLYDLTNDGAAVGLFANRNHQAALLACMFPILAAYAAFGVTTGEQSKSKGWAAISVAIVLVPLILVTGSRSGVLLSMAGIFFGALIYRNSQSNVSSTRKTRRHKLFYAVAVLGIATLGAITFFMSRAQALSRFSSRSPSEELRFQIWGPIVNFAAEYLPFGSGTGSFAVSYQIYEPVHLLMPSYVNQAHNDFIDVYLTAGVSGIIIILFSLVAVARAGIVAFRGSPQHSQSKLLAKTGFSIFVILAAASLTDYPLRIPILSAFLSICLLWLFGIRSDATEKAGTS